MYDQTKTASHVHNIRKFMSLKNDTVVRTMSVLEFDFCFHLEYNPDVKSFISQPESLYYSFNGRRCRYTSDFLATDQNGKSSLIEVKHSKQINKSDFRARFAEKKKTAAKCYGLDLHLITDKQIRTTTNIGSSLNFAPLHNVSSLCVNMLWHH